MKTWEALLSTVQVAQQLSCQSGGREERLSDLRGAGGWARGVVGAPFSRENRRRNLEGKDHHAQAPEGGSGATKWKT